MSALLSRVQCARKFADPQDREEIRKAKTPDIAARLGRSRKKKLRPDWDSARLGVMRIALKAKFASASEAPSRPAVTRSRYKAAAFDAPVSYARREE